MPAVPAAGDPLVTGPGWPYRFRVAQRPRTAEAEAFLLAFGRRIRELRRERGLSQQRLGELAGLDRQTMNRLETAAHAISTAHLGALSRALGVPPQELMPTDVDDAVPSRTPVGSDTG